MRTIQWRQYNEGNIMLDTWTVDIWTTLRTLSKTMQWKQYNAGHLDTWTFGQPCTRCPQSGWPSRPCRTGTRLAPGGGGGGGGGGGDLLDLMERKITKIICRDLVRVRLKKAVAELIATTNVGVTVHHLDLVVEETTSFLRKILSKLWWKRFSPLE